VNPSVSPRARAAMRVSSTTSARIHRIGAVKIHSSTARCEDPDGWDLWTSLARTGLPPKCPLKKREHGEMLAFAHNSTGHHSHRSKTIKSVTQ